MTQILLHSVINESNHYHYEANHYFMRVVEITIFLLLPTFDNHRELSTSLPSMLGTFWPSH